MTLEQFLGLENPYPEWQQTKRRLFEHLDDCELCREHQNCAEAVRLMASLPTKIQ